jgi:hypothetical protein
VVAVDAVGDGFGSSDEHAAHARASEKIADRRTNDGISFTERTPSGSWMAGEFPARIETSSRQPNVAAIDVRHGQKGFFW